MSRKAAGFALSALVAVNLGGCPETPVVLDVGVDANSNVPDVRVMRDTGAITGDAFAAYREQQAAAIAAECECNFMTEMDASPAACVTRRTMELRAECTEAGYNAARSTSATSFRCQAAAFLAYNECRTAATCADTMAITACVEAANAEFMACPDLPMAYTTAARACIVTNYIGAASTCPEPGAPWMGAGTFTGDTMLAGDDSNPDISCFEEAPDNLEISSDRAYRWIAPTPGVYTFDTIGTAFDTILYVRNACADAAPIACNDDIEAGMMRQSRLTVTATMPNQEFIVIVDGFFVESSGPFTVHVSEPGPLPPMPDAGPVDAGPSDAGRDGGPSAGDAGSDAGPSDAGVDARATKS